jgi:hypothetical protein
MLLATFRRNVSPLSSGIKSGLLSTDKTSVTTYNTTRISNYSDDCLLGCWAMQSRLNWPTFQRCLLLPSSGRWWWKQEVLKQVGQALQEYTAQHPRRHSSHFPPWVPEISQSISFFFLAFLHSFFLYLSSFIPSILTIFLSFPFLPFTLILSFSLPYFT